MKDEIDQLFDDKENNQPMLDMAPEILEEPALDQAPQEQQIDSSEEKAKKYGHLSKEEWEAQGRDPNKWKSPEQFNKFGEEYSEVKDMLKSYREQISKMSTQIESLTDFNKRSAEEAVRQAREGLEQQIRQAKEFNDVVAIEQLTRQKTQMEFQEQQQKQQQEATARQEIDMGFLQRNSHWFNNENPQLVQKAQQVANEIAQYYPNINYAEQVRRIEERMKFEHPELSGNAPAQRPIQQSRSAVNKSSIQQNTSGSDQQLYRNLSNDDKMEYQEVKKMLDARKIPYTVSEFIQSKNNIMNNRGF